MVAPASSSAASLGLDSRSLDSLRNQAAADPRAATRQAAVQFESLFMNMVMKSMRDATVKAEDGGAGGATDNFTSMLDGQFAKQFAGRPGGLADVIERQLSRHMQSLPAVSAENQPAPAGALQAPAGTAKPAATRRQAEFIQKLLPHARAAEAQTGVPASFILGQAALESGWGKGEIRNADGSNSFNLFGVKATSAWKGASAQVMTTEYVDGQAARQSAKFRSYGSYTEAFADYARMIAGNPRYAGVVRNASTVEAFAGGMQRAGYATDPQYASKLSRTIHTTLALQRAYG